MAGGEAADRRAVRLALAEAATDAPDFAPWIGPLVALGGMVRGHLPALADRQLVIALSVPRRDFAAVLVGCGWVINAPPPRLVSPLGLCRSLLPGDGVRLVTSDDVVVDRFQRLVEDGREPEVHLSNTRWMVSGLLAAARAAPPDDPVRMPRPRIGALARWGRLDGTWDARLAAPSSDLALVGTLRWLRDDLRWFVLPDDPVTSAHPRSEADRLEGLLLPRASATGTWNAELYTSAHLAEQLPLSEGFKAVVLDGLGAIKYLGQIEAPLVVCLVDRSVVDESAAEHLTQLRNTRGEPVSLRDELAWRPPPGVEALAFTMAL